ncbi:phytanoyl-CoA dioxygenase [Flavobacterium psychrophilum]|nr:phytanoyl-CoA dioxygenase [Flavobacterium psychrophilum]AOE53716.1 phytanoyl-CoA dioxygenase [Flavobacterium psychrophilum]
MPHTILETLWQRSVSPESENADSWEVEMETLYRLGISMEDTMRYLYSEKPTHENFKNWVDANRKDTVEPDDLREDVLTPEDLDFYNTNGYVIVRKAICKPDCEATQKAIWDFLRMSPDDKTSWYVRHEEQRGLMVSFFDHETLNKNRFSARIKKAYQQLYKTQKVYRTIDKVSFNPPENNHFTYLGSALHWDVSLKTPIPFALQGLLYLTDCGPDDGAFHCVPGFHKTIENWLANVRPHESPRDKALQTLTPIPIAANAGDFIIWNNTLPHCATPNRGKAPRMVQYLSYLPEGYKAASEFI